MSENWFFDQNFNLIEDNFFDDVNFDPSLDDVNLDQSLNDINLEGDNNVSAEKWDADFQSLEPPPPMFYGDSCSAGLDENQSHEGSSSLNLLPNSWRASSTSMFLHDNSADAKGASLFQTSSPVSVLESSSSCSGPAENLPVNPKLNFPVKRTRGKRKRASTFSLQLILPLSSSSSTGDGSESDSHLAEKSSKKKKKNLMLLSGSSETKESDSQQLVVRKCLHCGITKTPQWREGPNGPKTLCNACGVRYRSGRLVPEYRPAASPTFVPSLHSNSHRKIVEMRKKAEEMGKRVGLHATAAA
ncbi:hypothetical protein SLEP1_g19959 [Rubroshorea leprosula]|uniref:GATA-type domain-containing protein n=2 Tax=Rubroshorea leprosula TaxID=152421 RepID=A0AAV5JBM1_9ROSI|nr:hypothetical protein SLEP1_g19959 [Rubroshorea leprosula]